MALGIWLAEPAAGWAVAVGALGGAVLLAALRERRAVPLLSAAAAVAAAAAVLVTTVHVRAVERDWPALRERLIQQASRRLDETLGQAVERARTLAARGAAADTLPRPTAFRFLADAVTDDGPEQGVVLFAPEGRPWAWAGRHRLEPEHEAPELSARMTAFYVVLEARRQAGRALAVAQVLLAADSAVPDRERSVAAQFVRATGAGLEFYQPLRAPPGPDVFDYCLPSCTPSPGIAADTLFSVRPVPPGQGARKLELLERGRRGAAWLAVVSLALLVAGGGVVARWGGVFGAVALMMATPVGRYLGAGALFDAATYYLDALGPLSRSAGALLLSAAAGVMLLVALAGKWRPRLRGGVLVAALVLLGVPFAMWRLAEGISPPTTGVATGVWLSWQASLAVVGALITLAASLVVGQRMRRVPDGVPWAACGLSVILAALGLLLWTPGTGWPAWYPLVWVVPLLLAVLPEARALRLVAITTVTGTVAALLTWQAVMENRLLLAERDFGRLRGGDPVAISLLERFGTALLEDEVPRSAAALYARWRRSPLSQDDYPAALVSWAPDGHRLAFLELADLDPELMSHEAFADSARRFGRPLVTDVQWESGLHYVAAVPFADGSVVTVAVAPRSRLIQPVLVARFLRGERRLVAPYDLSLGEPVVAGAMRDQMEWTREQRWTVRGTGVLELAGAARHLHLRVPLGEPSQLVVRGALLIVLDMVLVGLLALGGQWLAGRVEVPAVVRELGRLRSYRTQLTLVLAGFFVIPTLGFAAWSIGRLRADAERSQDLLIQQTLSDAVGTARQFRGLPGAEVAERLDELADRLGADLLWYDDGVLEHASAAVLAQLGLLEMYLQPSVYRALALEDELEVTAAAAIAGQLTRVGYRSLTGPRTMGPILAAPRLVDASDILREREDLAYGLLLATLLGLGGAAWLAALAARSLARPVQSLRTAAIAVGRGERLPPFDPAVPSEFVPVVVAFERMARDIEASQQALESARRRTAAVLRNVATGVVALDPAMRVTIANARAEQLFGVSTDQGLAVHYRTSPEWEPLWDWVRQFLASGREQDAEEFTVGVRRIHAQVASMHADPGGCVVALDDTTELTRAVRVLAWGELARQIAHEIKNPLTPIRLGIQHIQRARRDGSADFDSTLERTVRQILAEIERLDAIARAFARFGAPPAEAMPLARTDVVAVARDTAELYQLSAGPVVLVEADGVVEAVVRRDEVKEVLINLIENSRDAGAQTVTIAVRTANGRTTIEVRDDGRGIASADLPRIFEPQFSTTTSGTGLGLAICKRLVESWGGTIGVESGEGIGTTVRIHLSGDGAPGGSP